MFQRVHTYTHRGDSSLATHEPPFWHSFFWSYRKHAPLTSTTTEGNTVHTSKVNSDTERTRGWMFDMFPWRRR